MLSYLTAVQGLLVGHHDDPEGLTGCTVVLAPEGAVAGGEVRGFAPGTRETDLLRTGNLVQHVHAVLLAGGSAFGLAAASGVMQYLEEQRIGFDVGVTRVPIVPAAVLFDLHLGDPRARPGPEAGYAACVGASADEIREGNVGAGMGATVGKALGIRHATKCGLGAASVYLDTGVVVGALAAVNAFGDVLDWRCGRILAGARNPMTGRFLDTSALLKEGPEWEGLLGANPAPANTVLTVVGTDARLTKEEANAVARMAHSGLARAVWPAHTMYDGDTLFVLATGKKGGDLTAVGTAAAEAVAEAIKRAALAAEAAGGLPAARDLPPAD